MLTHKDTLTPNISLTREKAYALTGEYSAHAGYNSLTREKTVKLPFCSLSVLFFLLFLSLNIPSYCLDESLLFPTFRFDKNEIRKIEQNFSNINSTKERNKLEVTTQCDVHIIIDQKVLNVASDGVSKVINLISTGTITLNNETKSSSVGQGHSVAVDFFPDGRKKMFNQMQPFEIGDLRFPPHGIRIGDSWTFTQPFSETLPASVTVLFKLIKITPHNGDLLLEISLSLRNLSFSKELKIFLSQSGSFWFLLNKGCVLKSEINSRFEFRFSSPKRDIEKMSGKIKIETFLK